MHLDSGLLGSPPDNFTLTTTNKRIDQRLSDFQTGIGVAAPIALDT